MQKAIACRRKFNRATTYIHSLRPNTCNLSCTIVYISSSSLSSFITIIKEDMCQIVVKSFDLCKKLSVLRQFWPNQWNPNGAIFCQGLPLSLLFHISPPLDLYQICDNCSSQWKALKFYGKFCSMFNMFHIHIFVI